MKRSHKFIFIVLVLFIILRLPSLFEPHWYGDEGIYAAVTLALENGKILYQNIWDNKPPGIYLLYMLAGVGDRLFMIRLFSLIGGVFSIVGLWRLSQAIKLSKLTSILAVLIAIFLFGSPIWEANIANAENFFVPITIWALYFALKNSLRSAIVCGLLFSLALALKFHPLFDLAAISIFLIITPWEKIRVKMKYLTIVILSSLTLPILGLLFFVLNDNFKEAFKAIFIYNVNYTNFYSFAYLQEIKLIIFISIITLLTLLFLKKKLDSRTYFIVLLLFFEIGAVFFSGRRYNHYLLQIVPGFSLFAGYFITNLVKKKWLIASSLVSTGTLVFTLILTLFYLQPGTLVENKPIEYYRQFIKFVLNPGEGAFLYPDSDRKLNQIGQSIGRYDKKSIYFLTNLSWVYDYLDVVPVSRFLVAYHLLLVPEGESLLVSDLTTAKPTVIAIDKNELVPEKLQSLLMSQYAPDAEDDYFIYYKKRR